MFRSSWIFFSPYFFVGWVYFLQHFIHHRQKDRFIVDIFIYKGIRFKCACLELYWIACVKKHAVIEKSPREREKNNTENSLNYASNEDFQLALFVGNLLCLLQISMHFALLHINEMKKKILAKLSWHKCSCAITIRFLNTVLINW